MTGPAPKRWLAIRAVVPDARDDEIAALLGEGCLGAEIAHAGPGLSRVTVYAESDERSLLARAARVMRDAGVDPASSGLELTTLEDGRWVERWQASLRPVPIGRGFVVAPGATGDVDPGRVVIRLVPGRAFGTGEHPTTRLCVAALERDVATGSRWLDLGCGTGILAIVAALRGAGSVVAIDNDPEAVAVCRDVVEANGLAGAIEVRVGSADLLAGSGFDGVVANVASSFFLGHAGAIARTLRPGGLVLASGFLGEDVSDVRDALARAGLTEYDVGSEGDWAIVAARGGCL